MSTWRNRADYEREEARRRARAAFQWAYARGEYQALIEERLKDILTQAAKERGLTEVLASLRFVLKRLLAEEDDLSRLALGVSRVASAAIQTARAERLFAQEDHALALGQVLDELDRRAREAAERQPGPPVHPVLPPPIRHQLPPGKERP